LLAINRLCAPGSELAIEQRWYPATALDDLLDIPEGKIGAARDPASADIVLPTTDGRDIRHRRMTEPTAEQKSLLHQLGLTLPERLKTSAKCSADFWQPELIPKELAVA